MRESIEDLLDSGKRPIEVTCQFCFVDQNDAIALGKLVVDEQDRVSFTIYRDVLHSTGEEGGHPIVHATSNTTKFTLLNCIKDGCSYKKEFPYEEYDCGSMLVGSHMEQSDLERVNRYQCTFDELAIWLNVTLFESDHEGGEDRYTFSTTRTFVDSADCSDEVIDITLSAQYTGAHRGSTKLTATKTPWLHSKLKEPTKIDEIHRYLIRWHDLFTFVSLRGITWGAIYLGFEGESDGVRWVSRRYRRKEQQRRVTAYDLLFDFDDQRNDSSKVFNAWVQIYEKNQSSVRLFCSTFAGKNYHEHNFLSLVQTLESYQYSDVPKKVIPDTVYEPIRDSIITSLDQSIPNEIRKSIVDRLKHANSSTLAKLLLGVYDNVSSYFPDTYLTRTKVKERLQCVKDSRNNFVHNGRLAPSMGSDKYEDIFEDEELLRYLIIATIAKDSAIDPRSITETISRMIHDHSVSTLLLS